MRAKYNNLQYVPVMEQYNVNNVPTLNQVYNQTTQSLNQNYQQITNQLTQSYNQITQSLNQQHQQAIQLKNQTQAQANQLSQQDRNLKVTLNNVTRENTNLKQQEIGLKQILEQNQLKIQQLNSYLNGFVDQEFEEVSLAGNGDIILNNNNIN